MKINYEVSGTERKRLVQAISEITETKPKYLGVPSCAYQVGDYKVGKNGELTFNEQVTADNLELLVERLAEQGFEAEITKPAQAEKPFEEDKGSAPPEDEIGGLVIELPRESFTDTNLENLKKLIESKDSLIRNALGVKELPLEITEDKVSFPWFSFPVTAEEIKAYSAFITSLAKLAKEQKRVTAKPKEVENEKYAFRCFLLRLGFIGDEYKQERKILLSKLTGSSAFKTSDATEVE
ncbi:virulence protein [Dehalobacter sp. DCM]|uniref:virulence protein n=1 Tax=Dehalobacter sp. DCM TaxID=2907827 RepID=UPI0030815165|nr:virulence protein [Dehalobacter sp. DCM]